MMFDMIEMVFDKIRWNVMGIAVIIAWIITDFGDPLIALAWKTAAFGFAAVPWWITVQRQF